MSNFNEVEVAFEVPMTVTKLTEIRSKIELAISRAKRGQTVRIKIADEIALVVKDLDVPQPIQVKVSPAQS